MMVRNEKTQRCIDALQPLGSLLCMVLGLACAADEPVEDEPEPEATAQGRSCQYTSPFTQGPECVDYLGESWDDEAARADCDERLGMYAAAQACSNDDVLGRCRLMADTPEEHETVSYGLDAASCEEFAMGCTIFGGGTWTDGPRCEGDEPTGTGRPPFIQPILVCRDPVEGEPPGASANGQVCTWQATQGCTEEGRDFRDYADCEVIQAQRPYYPYPANDAIPSDDARLDDPSYAAELAWVREQITASSCVCCHTDTAPMGPSNWSIDAPANWMSTFFDTGLAFGAGWIDSTAFGAYAPEDNNGFDRSVGFPSTDPDRMQRFFAEELAHRGRTPADFAEEPPFGGPLYDQLVYEPEGCTQGERIDPDGTIHWSGGAARYVYVLEKGSRSPTVPPNLDRPEGTLWRIDVPPDGDPLASGSVRYGDLPTGTVQQIPADGPPAALTPGREYYLYVTADVIFPITRCLLRAP
jgi:hypothetical protein